MKRIKNIKDLRKKGKFVKWEAHFLDYIQMVNVGCDLMLPLSNSAIYPMHFDPTTRPRSLLPDKFIGRILGLPWYLLEDLTFGIIQQLGGQNFAIFCVVLLSEILWFWAYVGKSYKC